MSPTPLPSKTASARREALSSKSGESAELASLRQSSTRLDSDSAASRACAGVSERIGVGSPAVVSSLPPSLTGAVKSEELRISAERSLEISSGDFSEKCTPEENGGEVDDDIEILVGEEASEEFNSGVMGVRSAKQNESAKTPHPIMMPLTPGY